MSTDTVPRSAVVSTPGVCGGKPRVDGTRIRVQDIAVWHYRRGLSPEEIAAGYPQLSLAAVHAALAYYWEHREAIQRDMEEAERAVERLRSQFAPKLPGKLRAAGSDGLPPR